MNLSLPLVSSIFPLPATNLQEGLILLFAFVIAHALADFPLQGDFLSKNKSRSHAKQVSEQCPNLPPSLWFYCLTAHSLIHAGFVWIVSGSVALAAIETVVHWVTDYAKCEGWTNFHVDQILHFLSRVVYVGLLLGGVVT